MSIQAILTPVFVQVLLVFVLLGLMARSRMAVIGKSVQPRDIALSGEAFPPRSRQYANAYGNQFEMPVLFYVAVILGIVVHQAGWLFVVLEWLFVAARLGQAFVHVTSNDVSLRGPFFIASAFATLLLWLLLAVGVLIGAS